MVPQMMGIAKDGRQGRWVLRRMAPRVIRPQMIGAADDMATYNVTAMALPKITSLTMALPTTTIS